MSRLEVSDINVPDIWVRDIRNNLEHGTSKTKSGLAQVKCPFVLIFDICESLLLIYREELVREEMCVEFLENHLHDDSKEFDIPQL